MPVEVRDGQASDADHAVDVWKVASTARRGGVPLPAAHEQRVRGYLGQADTFFVIAHDEALLVGMALGMQARENDGAGSPLPGLCHIAMVFVRPGWWRQGIGTKLMRRLLAAGAQRGHARYQLWAHADNVRAQSLYERLGFVRSGREKDDHLGEREVHFQLGR